MQGMMDNMQGMMQHMQGMMERMQNMMGRQGMGMAAQDEEDDEEASPPRGMMGMMGPGSMIRRHMERLAHQLELTDDQRMQVRTLLGNHAKEAIRLRADIGVMAVDLRQLLETDPVDLPKVKQQLQSIAGKEVDLRLAHITLMQEISTLLTPEQRQKFRAMRESMMGPGGMRGMMGPRGMREPGGIMGRGRHER
jgi:Spy/CpxP family protein refolding chaperone